MVRLADITKACIFPRQPTYAIYGILISWEDPNDPFSIQ